MAAAFLEVVILVVVPTKGLRAPIGLAICNIVGRHILFGLYIVFRRNRLL